MNTYRLRYIEKLPGIDLDLNFYNVEQQHDDGWDDMAAIHVDAPPAIMVIEDILRAGLALAIHAICKTCAGYGPIDDPDRGPVHGPNLGGEFIHRHAGESFDTHPVCDASAIWAKLVNLREASAPEAS